MLAHNQFRASARYVLWMRETYGVFCDVSHSNLTQTLHHTLDVGTDVDATSWKTRKRLLLQADTQTKQCTSTALQRNSKTKQTMQMYTLGNTQTKQTIHTQPSKETHKQMFCLS